MTEVSAWPKIANLPHHVAIIPDGNRRWAKERGLPDLEGHRRGTEAFTQVAKAARELGVHTFTAWGFSTENWNRSAMETKALMQIFESSLTETIAEAKKYGVRIYHLGRKDRLPKTLVARLTQAEEETKAFTNYVFNIALDYGGQDEILRAILKVFEAMKKGELKPEDLPNNFKNFLDTRDQPYPYPDLIIRTGNEKRLSGLYCWQGAYAELYWEPAYFPDFTPEKLRAALEDFSQRHRRFGGN